MLPASFDRGSRGSSWPRRHQHLAKTQLVSSQACPLSGLWDVSYSNMIAFATASDNFERVKEASTGGAYVIFLPEPNSGDIRITCGSKIHSSPQYTAVMAKMAAAVILLTRPETCIRPACCVSLATKLAVSRKRSATLLAI